MVIKARGEFVEPMQQINLVVQYKDQTGTPINADSYPKVSIVQPDGLVLLAPTSVGVGQIGPGKYNYIFTLPINGPYGIWSDIWLAYINGFRIEQQFSFVSSPGEVPGPSIDGYIHLGDDPGYHYSQDAIKNINKLIKLLRARLNSSGKAKSTDGYGNTIYISCDIFSVDMLVAFLAQALMEFNELPYFTLFDYTDNNFVDQFGNVLVEGATLYALASKALIERGREYSVTDSGISFALPTVSELMMTQYNSLIGQHFERLKMIKNSLRPAPKSLGVWSMGGGNPAVRRLRFLRQRQII